MAKPGSLAAIIGAPDSGAVTPDDDADDAGSDFESAAGDAFPELKDDPSRMAAFKQAIMACMGDDY